MKSCYWNLNWKNCLMMSLSYWNPLNKLLESQRGYILMSNFLRRQEVRQFTVTAGITQRLGRIAFNEAFAKREAKKAPQRRQPTSDRRLGVPRLVQRRNIGPQVHRRQFARPRRPTKTLLQVLDKRCQVLAVGLDRQIGRIAFDIQESQVTSDGADHGAGLSNEAATTASRRRPGSCSAAAT